MIDSDDPAFKLASQAGEILKNPERVYDLVGRRLALTSIALKNHFLDTKNTFRLGVIGNPNVGKTTYSYSISKILELYKTPTTYIDLDVHTESGRAMSGEITWEERRKRKSDEIPLEEVNENIAKFANAGPGIVIGDFPGRISNEFNPQRLKRANLALIFGRNYSDVIPWMDFCTKCNVGYRFAISREDLSLKVPIYPQVDDLNRKFQITTPLMASATSILLEASKLTDGPKINFDNFFSQPELVVLEEVYDFLFSIGNI